MAKRFLISAKGLTRKFGALAAVDSVSLSVGQGEFFGLLGPNGAGKTTLVRLLTGQIRPSSGSASVMGVDVASEPIRVRELVGVMPEQETPPSFLTAAEYLDFVGRIRKLDRLDDRCAKWLDFFGMNDKADVLCKDLSRGTRQKLMFAQAFIHEPRLAFIDEPLINLDPLIQKRVRDYLQRFVKGGGTVFFCTHVLEVAQRLCSRVAVIDRGKIVYDGSMSQVRRRGRTLEDVFLGAIGNA